MFAGKLIAVGLIAVGSAQFGWAYAESRSEAANAEPVLALPATSTTPLAPLAFSASSPPRVVERLTPSQVVPAQGKFILADLQSMTIRLYLDGVATTTLPIKTTGKPGTPWETPAGFYAIQTKEENHFSSIGKVNMPYSMQFYGNYFIHGWTTYLDGTPTPVTFSGGCIKLDTADAAQVFAFADVGTKLFVYDPPATQTLPPLALSAHPEPRIDADSYLIADLDTGDVYAEHFAQEKRPIASITKLMTALVANESISFDKKISVPEGVLTNPRNMADVRPKHFVVGDLLYPLLMQSSNHVADALAEYYGPENFVRWMNTEAQALGMNDTVYADPSGISPENVSTTEDLFRLAAYIAHKKSFIFGITKTPDRAIVASDGSRYTVINVNEPANQEPFAGGKIGHTDEARDTMVSLLSIQQGDAQRRVALIVLGSDDQARATKALAKWMLARAKEGPQTACVLCTSLPEYRRISF